MNGTLQFLLPFLVAAMGIGIGWRSAVLRHDRQVRKMNGKRGPYSVINAIDVEKPVMRRPMEFGPILQPRDVVDRIRDAIVEDQLGARRESAAQRRRRIQRYRGHTDRQRVQHWLLHWREDYIFNLTGQGVAFE